MPHKLYKKDLTKLYNDMANDEELGYILPDGTIGKLSKEALGNMVTDPAFTEDKFLLEDPQDTETYERKGIEGLEAKARQDLMDAANKDVLSIEEKKIRNKLEKQAKSGKPETPQQKRNRKIAEAKFPRLRTWWEDVKYKLGNEKPSQENAPKADIALAGEVLTPEESAYRKQALEKLQSGQPETNEEKIARKIAEAKFPRARAWWENLKAQFGHDRTPEEKIKHAAFPRARAAWEGTKEKVSNAGQELLLGKPEFENFTPEQQKLIARLGQLGIEGLENNQYTPEKIEEAARHNFSTRTIPSITERFSNSGGSSALGNQLREGGQELEHKLAGLKYAHGAQQQGHFTNLAQLGITPKFPNATYDPNASSGLLNKLAPLAISAGSKYLGL